jgi:hypothetical protein
MALMEQHMVSIFTAASMHFLGLVSHLSCVCLHSLHSIWAPRAIPTAQPAKKPQVREVFLAYCILPEGSHMVAHPTRKGSPGCHSGHPPATASFNFCM